MSSASAEPLRLWHGADNPAIVRTEPRAGVREFASDLLPLIEFQGEDLPWRHTPRATGPDADQLTPWLTLAVLERDEFRFTDAALDDALPWIEVRDPARVLPRADQLWAWAHVQTDGDGMARSRLLCPRQLRPNTDYWAFVLPSFERERLAGLGLDPSAATHDSQPAWGRDSNGGTRFPYFYTWHFRSSSSGDFESLVRRLVPRKLDARLGLRELDVQTPGLGLDHIADPPQLELAGALRAAAARPKPWPEQRPDVFQVLLAELLNRRTHDRSERINGIDPSVTPPIYGRWYASTEPLDARERNWVNQLNLDPRGRVAAGLGAAVVRAKRDDLVHDAARQLGDALAADVRMHRAELAREVSHRLITRHIAARPPASALQLLAPLQTRVLWDVATTVDADAPLSRVLVGAQDEDVWPEEQGGQQGGERSREVVRTSVAQTVADSSMSPTLLSPAFRRLTRARGPLMRRVGADAAALLARASDEELTATPDKRTPAGAMTYAQLREHTEPSPRPQWLLEFGRDPVLQVLVVLMLLFGLLGAYAYFSVVGFAVLALADAVLAVYVLVALRRVAREFTVADSLTLDSLTPEWAERADIKSDYRPLAREQIDRAHVGSSAAPRWRRALVDFHAMFDETPTPPPLAPTLDLTSLVRAMQDAVLGRLADETVQTRTPVFDWPMVDALVDMSPQWLLPHIELIGNNTIALVEINQAFIEAYMVGLNHEMARELSWRGISSDRRATYFRRFWQREPDMPPLASWPLASALGSHATQRASLVLVMRGDLLAQYPHTLIRARRAKWDEADGHARKLAEADPERVRDPVLAASIEGDLAIVGFELSADEARGDDEDPGWFLVFEQPPAEPSFARDDGGVGMTSREPSSVAVHAAELLPV